MRASPQARKFSSVMGRRISAASTGSRRGASRLVRSLPSLRREAILMRIFVTR